MVDGGGGAAFPVVFFDGEREINIGDIRVQPMLGFKMFQKMIADGIGISPNQISIYIVHQSSPQEERRRIPITGKVNFSLIIRQRNCFFLVILKRSRRYRSRKSKPNGTDYGDYSSDGDFLPSPPPENVVLLRRSMPEFGMNSLEMDGYSKPLYQQVSQLGNGGLDDRLRDLTLQEESYRIAIGEPANFMSLGGAPNLNPNLHLGSFPRIEETISRQNVKERGNNKVVCAECVKAKKAGCSASFHACANDPLVEVFRSPAAGPIARPGKAFY